MIQRRAPIGIIGGMGPHAGLLLAEAVLKATVATRDQDYPAIALLSYSDRIPDRTAWLLGKEPADPAEAILDVATDLGRIGVTWAGMACNTAHAPAIFDRVSEALPERAPGLGLVHMIDETADFCREVAPGARRIGILATLGTYEAGLYQDALLRAGLEPVLPDPTTRVASVHRAIYDPDFGIKSHPVSVTDKARTLLGRAIDELTEAGAEAVILGCTELSLVFAGPTAFGLPAVDATTALARALVRKAAPDRLARRT